MLQPLSLKPQPKARTPRQQLKRRPPWHRPKRPNLWWRCAAMTVPVKRKPRSLQDETAAVMADLVNAVHAPAATVAQAALVSEAGTVLVTVARVAKVGISVKTEDPAWAMPLSVPSAKPWSALKCRCANWPHKPMVKPSLA